MSQFLKLIRVPALGWTVAIATTLLVACGDRHTMAVKSQRAFEEAEKKGIPIGKNAHGGHTGMGSEEMKGMGRSAEAEPGRAGSPAGMKGMDMSGAKSGGMKGMDMSGTKMSPVIPQPAALEGRAGETAATLRADPVDTPAPSSVTSAQHSVETSGEMTMAMGSYVQHDVGRATSSSQQMNGMEPGMAGMSGRSTIRGGPAEQMPAMKHDTPMPSRGGTGAGPKKSAVTYVCSSHPEIVRDRPGKCPIDGTSLVKKEKQ